MVYLSVQSILITHEFHIYEFSFMLKLICKPQMNTQPAEMQSGKKIESRKNMVSGEG